MSITGTTADSLIYTGAATGRVVVSGTSADDGFLKLEGAAGFVDPAGGSAGYVPYFGSATGYLPPTGRSSGSLPITTAEQDQGAMQAAGSAVVRPLALTGAASGMIVQAAVLGTTCVAFQDGFAAPGSRTAFVPLAGGNTVTAYVLPVANPLLLDFTLSLDVSPDGVNFVSAGSFKVHGDRTTLQSFSVTGIVASYARLTQMSQNQGANALVLSAWISAR